MIDVNELRKGVTFEMDGELYQVLDYQHHKLGRGKAIIRTTIRNLRTGASIDKACWSTSVSVANKITWWLARGK